MRFFKGNSYRKEITLVIITKIFALLVLWLCFFSHPAATDTMLQMQRSLLSMQDQNIYPNYP